MQVPFTVRIQIQELDHETTSPKPGSSHTIKGEKGIIRESDYVNEVKNIEKSGNEKEPNPEDRQGGGGGKSRMEKTSTK